MTSPPGPPAFRSQSRPKPSRAPAKSRVPPAASPWPRRRAGRSWAPPGRGERLCRRRGARRVLPPRPSRAQRGRTVPSRAEPSRAEPSGTMLGMIKNSLLSTVEPWPYRVLSKGEKVGGGAGCRARFLQAFKPWRPGRLRALRGERVSSGQRFPRSPSGQLPASPCPSPSPGTAQLRGEDFGGRAVRDGGGGGEAVRRSLEGRGAQAPQVRRRDQRQG